MAFPSVLLFNNTPSYVYYGISSKHLPEKYAGAISFIYKIDG